MIRAAIVLCALLLWESPVLAKGGPSGRLANGRESIQPEGVARDARGRIARSSKAKGSFCYANPCPSTGRTKGACPGHVIDHVIALKRGGADVPANMQWQTREAARAKDRIE